MQFILFLQPFWINYLKHIEMALGLILLGLGLGLVLVILLFKIKAISSKLFQLQQLYNDSLHQLEERSVTIGALEQTLADTERLAILARQTENAVMLMDSQGNILWVNDSFTRMYEYSHSEFTRKLGDNIRKTSFNPKIIERLERVARTKEPVVYEALNITKSGKEIWTRTALLPLLDPKKEIIGLVTVASDIHKRVVATDELIRHVHSSNEKIERIAGQLDVLVELMDSLFERIDISQRRIDRTDKIIGRVKEISDQTKILGINASIEAHAAGENGKGFRVIANEIVNVSNSTNSALHEISELVTKIQSSSDKLATDKELSGSAISSHRTLIAELKREINEVQCVVQELR
jgi:PAS domain S-box-containing protein